MSTTLTTGKLVLTNTTSNQDATDRLRVTNTVTLFDYSSCFGKRPIKMNELLTGTATSTANNGGYIALRCATGGSGGRGIIQSYEYVPYQAGSSKLLVMTGVMETSGGVTGSISRMGIFDDSTDKTTVIGAGNGHFFQLIGTGNGTGTMSVVERQGNLALNGQTDTIVSQSSWNLDKLNGSGSSGINISTWNNAMVFVIDVQWLGVGRVRFGIYQSGVITYVHQFTHPSIQMPYTQHSKLPVRFELSTSGITLSEMRVMCVSVSSETGYIPASIQQSYITSTSITVQSMLTPILSIKLIEIEPSNRITLVVQSIEILNTSSNSIAWQLLLLPSSSSLIGSAFAIVNSTLTQIDINATAISTTNSFVLASGFVGINQKSTQSTIYNFDSYSNSPIVNSSITGVSRVLCLCASGIGGTAPCYGSITWCEVI